MSDMRDFLGRGIEGFNPSPEEGLERTRDRTRKRHRRRQFLAGAVTVAMFGGTLAGAVWLGDQRGRPIAGPTPTPTAAPSLKTETDPAVAPPPDTALGTDTCQGPFFGHIFCVEATSDVVVVGSGKTNGIPWALYAWTGTYRGPEPGRPHDEGPEPDVELPVLCTAWFFGELRQPRCQGTTEEYDSWSMALVEMPGVQREAFRGSGALAFQGSSGGYVIDPRDGITALWSWTPKETAEVTLEGQSGLQWEAELFGPAPRLGNGVKWFVAFVPTGAGPLTARAIDEAGLELWHEADPPIPTAFPRRPPFEVTSPIRTVAMGNYGDGDWELLVYTAENVQTSAPNLCFLLVIRPDEDPVGPACTQLEETVGGAMGLDNDGDGPLPGIVYGSTSRDTARVEISEAGEATDASLHPSPAELGMDLQFFVGLTPRKADVTIRAYDADGGRLWSDVHPYHPD